MDVFLRDAVASPSSLQLLQPSFCADSRPPHPAFVQEHGYGRPALIFLNTAGLAAPLGRMAWWLRTALPLLHNATFAWGVAERWSPGLLATGSVNTVCAYHGDRPAGHLPGVSRRRALTLGDAEAERARNRARADRWEELGAARAIPALAGEGGGGWVLLGPAESSDASGRSPYGGGRRGGGASCGPHSLQERLRAASLTLVESGGCLCLDGYTGALCSQPPARGAPSAAAVPPAGGATPPAPPPPSPAPAPYPLAAPPAANPPLPPISSGGGQRDNHPLR